MVGDNVAFCRSVTAVNPADPGTSSTNNNAGSSPVRFYHLAIVGVFSFGLGATAVWLLLLRLGPTLGGSTLPASKSPPGADQSIDAGAPCRAVCVANGGGGRFSKYHLPLPVYPRNNSATTSSSTLTQTADRPAPPIDVRQYFHVPNS